jgi:hypothetical protein
MAFRSGGRQGVSRMKSRPRQISRVRSSSTVSKYGGRSSTPTIRTSTTHSLRTNPRSTTVTRAYNNPLRGGSKSQSKPKKEVYVKPEGKYVTSNPAPYGRDKDGDANPKPKDNWNKGFSATSGTKAKRDGVKSIRTNPRYTTVTRAYNKPKTSKTKGATKIVKKSKTNVGAKIKIAKYIKAPKITVKKAGAKAGKLSVKGVRMGPKGPKKPQTTTRGGPHGTSTTTMTSGGRIWREKRRDSNAPYRRDNPRKSLSDEYANLGRIY